MDKATLLRWLEEDEEFRDKFVMLLMRAPILVELRGLREDFNKRFMAHEEEMRRLREDFNRLSAQVAENTGAIRALQEQVAELREDFNKRFQAFNEEMRRLREDFNKRFEAHEEEIRALREDFNRLARRMDRGFEKMERTLSSLGIRWGLGAEEAFKRAFSSLLAELGYEVVGSLRLRDEWGIVKAGAVGREYEYDLCIKDEEIYLLEIKARVSWWDVELFKRKLDLYERYHGRRPKLIIVSPFVEEDAKREAEALGFKVFAYNMEQDSLIG